MVNQKSTPFTESKTRVDFWKKFDEEWAELNRHKNKFSKARRSSGSHGRNRVDPSKIWAGGQAVQTDKTVSKIYSSDKTHDGSQRPCRLVWMPSLLAIPFLPKSQHV
jgi:hypothetical protein